MKICESCFHSGLCIKEAETGENCVHYKNKKLVPELPCAIGDKVYAFNLKGYYENGYKPYVEEKTVTEISWKYSNSYDKKDLGFGIIAEGRLSSNRYSMSSLGKSLFLSKEEAEIALSKKVKK